tara:strand:- start:10610 stop:11170 length:561 start_codon:yes stop_codon:yes gene_type:complete
MKSFALIAAASVVMSASADTVLSVDLSVVNEVTVIGTGGNSAATVSGSSFTGAYMADFFTGAGGTGFLDSQGVGGLTNTGNLSDGTPGIFNLVGHYGLNIWTWTAQTVNLTANSSAFESSATWTVDSTVYASMLAGNLTGEVFFAADTDDDIPSATYIGTWEVKVPAPSSVAILGLGGIVAGRRRR